ncbi:MAG: demethoxyubiquinone hydroxylase family protein, partial [Gammaproteobacteria bacterium]|nr:demethoxyubiquinone hydroxylase family protein [Gammaproteobacteria bacterium]
MRRYSRLDRLCIEANHLVQTLLTPASSETHSPAKDIPECEFSEQERRHVAGLMRVDHVGEICA